MNDLVLALGQTLRRDDGAAAALVASFVWPTTCRVRVLPQLVPELVDELARATRVLFVDAALDCIRPTLEPLRGVTSPPCFSHFAHPTGLLALCEQLHGQQPPGYLLRLPAFDLGVGEGLSAELQTQLPDATTLLAHWLAESLTTGRGGM